MGMALPSRRPAPPPLASPHLLPLYPAPPAAANPGVNQDALAVPQRAYPAGYQLPNIISVAATTSTDTLASFSNYGA